MKPVAPPTGDRRPDPGFTAAVVVTYHPDPGLYDRMLPLVAQVAAILIVDNGSTDDELVPVQRLVADGHAETLLNAENRGQATALNQGLAWASDRGIPWVLTLDQDTQPGSELVAVAGLVFDADRPRPLAVIGAGWLIPPRSRPDCGDPTGLDVVWAVTSGALHSVATWRALGGFRDRFFIDYVDIEYCLRARSAGYTVARVCAPTMVHAYGTPTSRRILYKRVQPSNHGPARRYFNARNRISVWRSFVRSEPNFVAQDCVAWVKEVAKLVLFEDQRLQKLSAMVRGVRDAVRGRSGPLPEGPIRPEQRPDG